MMTTKQCPHCEVSKSHADFYSSRYRGGGGISAWCRACVRAQRAKYLRDRVDRESQVATAVRWCASCQAEKSVDQFGALSSYCRACHAERARRARAADPNLSRRSHLKYKYGMTLEQYDKMLMAQGGRCALCGATPKASRLHIDHDHACCPGVGRSCGECIRGLVCYPCNTKLSILESDSEYAVRLRAYAKVKVVSL